MNKYFKVNSSIHDYDVIFTKSFGQNLKEDLSSSCAVIIDETVYRLYKEILDPVLNNCLVFHFDANENNKSLKMIEKITVFLIKNGFKITHNLIAIGGGITQDVTCFIASTLFRGIHWTFYPTTLLAQCDSCIGSKSSINVLPFKNQLGTFYPPKKVVVDLSFTRTLKKEEILSGLGEAVKVHYLDEEQRYPSIFMNFQQAQKSLECLEHVVYDSLVIKKRVIEIDEYDRDYRNIMNYGHTIGHALESVTMYGIPHGIAVAFGLGAANYLSRELGFLSDKDFDKMDELISENTKNIHFQINSLDDLWMALQKDKKNIDGDVVFILTKGFGKMFKHKIPLDEKVKSIIISYLKAKNLVSE